MSGSGNSHIHAVARWSTEWAKLKLLMVETDLGIFPPLEKLGRMRGYGSFFIELYRPGNP